MSTDRRKRSFAKAAAVAVCLGMLGVAHANADMAEFRAELKLDLGFEAEVAGSLTISDFGPNQRTGKLTFAHTRHGASAGGERGQAVFKMPQMEMNVRTKELLARGAATNGTATALARIAQSPIVFVENTTGTSKKLLVSGTLNVDLLAKHEGNGHAWAEYNFELFNLSANDVIEHEFTYKKIVSNEDPWIKQHELSYSIDIEPDASVLFAVRNMRVQGFATASSVPEPASLSLLALGGLGALRRRA